MSNIAESLKPLIVPIDSVILDPRNARKHPKENQTALVKSLTAYGQRKPIVVNKRTKHIEAGNGLYQAAKDLGWTEIAAVFVDDDDITSKGYALMDNQSALLAEWEFPNLKDILTELDTGAFDMSLTGFDNDEIAKLMGQVHQGLTDDDVIPENVETICKKGDLWRMGGYIICPKCGKQHNL